MKKAVAFTIFGFLLLFGGGLLAGLHVFEPWDRILADKPETAPPAAGEMSWNTYKQTKLALGSFDLVNGLTKHELETSHNGRSLSFYYLLACLWLVVASRLGFRRPRKN